MQRSCRSRRVGPTNLSVCTIFLTSGLVRDRKRAPFVRRKEAACDSKTGAAAVVEALEKVGLDQDVAKERKGMKLPIVSHVPAGNAPAPEASVAGLLEELAFGAPVSKLMH